MMLCFGRYNRTWMTTITLSFVRKEIMFMLYVAQDALSPGFRCSRIPILPASTEINNPSLEYPASLMMIIPPSLCPFRPMILLCVSVFVMLILFVVQTFSRRYDSQH